MPFARIQVSRAVVRARSTFASRVSSTTRASRAARRGYASESGKSSASPLTSELPWMAGAGAATLGGLFFVLNSGPLSNPFVHPYPGDDYHGEGHGDHDKEDHEEEEGEGGDSDGEGEDGGEDGGDEKKEESGEDKEEAPAKDEEDEGDESKEDEDKPKAGSKTSGKRVTEQPDDGKLRRKVQGSDEETADWNQTHVLDREGSSTVIHKPDAKGGAKRRIESAYGNKQGEKQGDDETDDMDVAANSKTPVRGAMSGKQAGLSNTDTKHSYDLSESEHQKKDDGTPASAKLQGTVNARS